MLTIKIGSFKNNIKEEDKNADFELYNNMLDILHFMLVIGIDFDDKTLFPNKDNVVSYFHNMLIKKAKEQKINKFNSINHLEIIDLLKSYSVDHNVEQLFNYIIHDKNDALNNLGSTLSFIDPNHDKNHDKIISRGCFAYILNSPNKLRKFPMSNTKSLINKNFEDDIKLERKYGLFVSEKDSIDIVSYFFNFYTAQYDNYIKKIQDKITARKSKVVNLVCNKIYEHITNNSAEAAIVKERIGKFMLDNPLELSDNDKSLFMECWKRYEGKPVKSHSSRIIGNIKPVDYTLPSIV